MRAYVQGGAMSLHPYIHPLSFNESQIRSKSDRFLHLGGLRTALFNFLIARKHPEGRFILRIEDTDRSRIVDTAVEGLQRTLQWAGINYDEGPDKPAKYGPYIQSQRLPFYQEHSREIIENGRAYRCFCSKERLELIKGINGAGKVRW